MSEPLDLERPHDGSFSYLQRAHGVLLAEVVRLRGEVDLLRTLERELMAVLPYDDEDVETSLVVNAAQLRGELARQAEQITAVRALAHGWDAHVDGATFRRDQYASEFAADLLRTLDDRADAS